MRIEAAVGTAAAASPWAVARAPHAPVPVMPQARSTGWSSVGRVTDPRLTEISGVVASRAHPDTLWVHNDSGDDPRVFAIGSDGAVRGELRIDNARAQDWEDISFGPGPAGSGGGWLYVADTGNNFLVRRALSIYRFPEPSSLGDGSVSAQRLDVRFDDGNRHNVEAMFVDPRSGDTMLVTKTSGSRAQLFRIPAGPFDGSTVVAEQVAVVEVGSKVTGADISPDGSRIAIRTSGQVAVWERGAGDTIAQSVARVPVRFPAPSAEAIAFGRDGATLFSIGEGEGPSVETRRVPTTARVGA